MNAAPLGHRAGKRKLNCFGLPVLSPATSFFARRSSPSARTDPTTAGLPETSHSTSTAGWAMRSLSLALTPLCGGLSAPPLMETLTQRPSCSSRPPRHTSATQATCRSCTRSSMCAMGAGRLAPLITQPRHSSHAAFFLHRCNHKLWPPSSPRRRPSQPAAPTPRARSGKLGRQRHARCPPAPST